MRKSLTFLALVATLLATTPAWAWTSNAPGLAGVNFTNTDSRWASGYHVSLLPGFLYGAQGMVYSYAPVRAHLTNNVINPGLIRDYRGTNFAVGAPQPTSGMGAPAPGGGWR